MLLPLSTLFFSVILLLPAANVALADSVVATVPVGGTGPTQLTFDPANGNIYVSNFDSGTVSVISGFTNTVIASVPVGSSPTDVALDPTNGDIYVANGGSGTVSVITPSSVSTTAVLFTSSTPTSASASSQGTSTAAPTGGESPNYTLYLVVGAVALIVVALLLVLRRRK